MFLSITHFQNIQVDQAKEKKTTHVNLHQLEAHFILLQACYFSAMNHYFVSKINEDESPSKASKQAGKTSQTGQESLSSFCLIQSFFLDSLWTWILNLGPSWLQLCGGHISHHTLTCISGRSDSSWQQKPKLVMLSSLTDFILPIARILLKENRTSLICSGNPCIELGVKGSVLLLASYCDLIIVLLYWIMCQSFKPPEHLSVSLI